MFSPQKKQFKLDRWIIGKYKEGFPLSRFMEVLQSENISFKAMGYYPSSDLKTFLPDNVILKIDNTTVDLYFENINDEDVTSFYEYKLIAIGSSSHQHLLNTYPL